MTTSTTEDRLFDLPEFDVPQRESPCSTQWTYEEAMRAFEELAKGMRLREEPPVREDIPRFEM